MVAIVKKLQIKGLFETKNIEWALNDVNVLVGKNGAGKSTILQIIYGLLKQDGNESIAKTEECKLILSNDETIEHIINKLDVDTKQILGLLRTIHGNTSKTKNLKNINKSEVKKLISLLEAKTEGKQVKEIKISTIKTSDNLKDSEKIVVELISTVNMSANSIYEFKKSDGEKTTILDMEITAELERFKHLMLQHNEEFSHIQKALTETINELFLDCNKQVDFSDGDFSIKPISGNEKISFRILSSGERQLIYILLKAANTALKESVLLMDEPEISLHLGWQEKLIGSIKRVNKKCQLIIVTHSPAIIMKGWMDCFVDIKSIQRDIEQ
ncbi:AAA family ATPase [Citrobacter portucalensis]|uniref:AAA family ATPase n=1 Tax=Citrobacter portucalensis TaxID=1639133 RepID=UPI0022E5074C|nr:ATP-binding protein [Citrobacter portucalensis]